MSEKAQAVADEIEAGEADGNIHVAQERGQVRSAAFSAVHQPIDSSSQQSLTRHPIPQVVDTGGLTEEDLHSGVLRTDAEVQQAMGDSANSATVRNF